MLQIEYAVLCFHTARENPGAKMRESGTPKRAVRRKRAIDGESRSLAEKLRRRSRARWAVSEPHESEDL